jgi:IQ calmodulin-binding motif
MWVPRTLVLSLGTNFCTCCSQWLALRRMDRTRDEAARKFQALWKSVLIHRRFRQIKNSAITLQRLFLMKLHRTRFQRQTTAVRKIQSVARGYISREQVPMATSILCRLQWVRSSTELLCSCCGRCVVFEHCKVLRMSCGDCKKCASESTANYATQTLTR